MKWLASAMVRGGGLLTDEPGLGKTLQVIALVEAMVKAGLAVWCVKCIHVCVLDVCRLNTHRQRHQDQHMAHLHTL